MHLRVQVVSSARGRVPHPSFFEGWDSAVVSRAGFLADSCGALAHRVPDDPHHPPFPQSTRKGWGTQLTQPGCTIHAHAPCSTSGRTSRHNPRNTPSDARRFRGGTWRSEPDANAHIRRHCTPLPCRRCSPCLGSSHRSHDGHVSCRSVGEEIAFDASNYCISGAVRSVISLSPKARREYAVKPSPSSVTDEEL